MQQRVLVLMALLCAAVLSYYGYHYYQDAKKPVIEASGTIEAITLDLRARANGTIRLLAVKEGDSVNRDQLVAELSRPDLAAQVERDALSVAVAQALLDDLLAGSRTEEIKMAAVNVQTASANLEKARLDMMRAQTLFEASSLAEQELQKQELNTQNLERQLESAQAQLNLLEAGPRSQKIAAAAAELERSQAVLKTTQVLLEDLQLKSPLKGVIISKNYEAGEFVMLGSPLLSIADLEHLWIKVYIPTDQLPLIKIGQSADITVSGIRETFRGQVVEIASQGEFTPKTIQTKKERTNVVFAVKISVDNIDGILKPGMPADVTFKEELSS